MKTPVTITLFAAMLLFGCSKSTQTPAPAATSGANPTPASAPADYIGGLANAKNRAVGTVDLASLNQAVQMFNATEGRYPKDLDELIDQKLIVKVPDAPPGMKIDYDATTGKVSLVPKE